MDNNIYFFEMFYSSIDSVNSIDNFYYGVYDKTINDYFNYNKFKFTKYNLNYYLDSFSKIIYM